MLLPVHCAARENLEQASHRKGLEGLQSSFIYVKPQFCGSWILSIVAVWQVN